MKHPESLTDANEPLAAQRWRRRAIVQMLLIVGFSASSLSAEESGTVFRRMPVFDLQREQHVLELGINEQVFPETARFTPSKLAAFVMAFSNSPPTSIFSAAAIVAIAPFKSRFISE